MILGIPNEIFPGENRVALCPRDVKRYQDLGFTEVLVESGAGARSSFTDDAYSQLGARCVEGKEVWDKADVILKVRAPMEMAAGHEADLLRPGVTLISFLWPAQNEELVARLAKQKCTALGMDQVPRISRAQKMDALSSMANIAGYRAVIEAANHFGRFFTGQITAAGKVPPAKVLVIGAGVAGLASIGTAKGLGAIVRAFDTRPVVKDQVTSMGGEFLELQFDEDGTGEGGYAKVMSKEFIEAEMKLFADQAREVDIIITTALIPGRPAPKLITEAMVVTMNEGSVVVDLAAEQGGNCELTVPGEVVVRHGVTLIGLTDLPSRLPQQASRLYSANLYHLVHDMMKEGALKVDFEDQAVRGALVVHEGEVTWPPPKIEVPKPPDVPKAVAPPPIAPTPTPKKKSTMGSLMGTGALVAALAGIALYAPPSFLSHFTVFVLSCFLGWQVIWNVTPALHTPLMSVTNAISGIIVIGAIVQLSASDSFLVTVLALVSVFVATINISGGFLVTHRMLKMFRK